jgi:hypothetical protein
MASAAMRPVSRSAAGLRNSIVPSGPQAMTGSGNAPNSAWHSAQEIGVENMDMPLLIDDPGQGCR